MAPPASQAATNHFEIRPYLQGSRLGEWSYERTDVPPREDRPAVSYSRTFMSERFQEGDLEKRRMAPVAQYIQTSPPTASQPAVHERRVPVVVPGAAMVNFFELAEPMAPIPDELKPGQPITNSTELRFYDHYGRPSATGTLTRTAEIEGFESVETPAGKFDDCLRVRVDLSAQFPLLTFDWTSYLWLSRDAGEVRRVNRISGWFWIFYFGSSHDYRLAAYKPDPARTKPSLTAAATWARGVLVLSRVIPHPQIGGMLVEFTKP